MTASISLPRSYFEKIYKLRIAKDPKADPDDIMLKPVIDANFERIRGQAKNTIGAKTDDQIRMWITLTTPSASRRKSPAWADRPCRPAHRSAPSVTLYAKQGVLAVVALGALGMMLMMVRRAVPAGAGEDLDTHVFSGSGNSAGRRKKGEATNMDVGDDVFGEANEGDAVLTGIELDDETLKSRKMVDEVSTMIKDNPENAATLVKRWMTKGK